jgi:competence CoiA-like predicted nuclease
VRCRGCGGELRTRSGAKTVRHFFHKAKPDDCLLGGGEGSTHLRVKMAIAGAIEASGGTALVEQSAADRSFVVDVLGVWGRDSGERRVAFEVQVSHQTGQTTAERTVQRAAVCEQTVWALMRHPNGYG